MRVVKTYPKENLVDFGQFDLLTKRFHHAMSVSERAQKIMVEIHQDFIRYMSDSYFDEVQSILKEFIEEYPLKEEKRKALERNLFWWKLLYDTRDDPESGITAGFIAENYRRLMDKPLIQSWLREWDHAYPKFYYVGYKYYDGAFFVIDALEEKGHDVIMRIPNAIPPNQGEIVMGTLIPYGQSLYTPITDFYRFDYEAREAIGRTFKYHYNRYLKLYTKSEAFVHVLSVMLQIERLVDVNNKGMIKNESD
ncbi:MAG: hypothetical protein ACO1OC_11830 [Tuberibacillus sp.]